MTTHGNASKSFWEEKFWSRVKKTENCWLWTGTHVEQGYGYFSLRGKSVLAHRFSYQLKFGNIPAGLQLDHTCRVKDCVNPAHLEAVTHSENQRRKWGYRNNTPKTKCVRNHPLNKESIYVDKRGRKSCKSCKALSSKQYQLRNKEALKHARRQKRMATLIYCVQCRQIIKNRVILPK